MKVYRHYNHHVLIGLILSLLLIVGINAVIDPFALFKIISKSGFNREKPALTQNIRAFHLYQLQQKKPQTLILGSSRAQIGLNANHHGFKNEAYNLGMPLATIDEMRDYFVYANQLNPIKQAVISVDFFSFNAYLKSQSPFRNGGSFSAQDKVAALVGWSGVKGSLQTLKHNYAQQQTIQAHPDLQKISEKTQTIFEKSERFYLEQQIYFPPPFKTYSLVHQKTGQSTLQPYQEILDICQHNQIDCKVVILPVHVRQLALIEQLGLWQAFEDWKKRLVQVTEKHLPQTVIYDFTGFGEVHSEHVPQPNEPNQAMQWFVDSAHITPILGDLVLDVVLLNRSAPQLGGAITVSNIESHLQRLNLNKYQYNTLAIRS